MLINFSCSWHSTSVQAFGQEMSEQTNPPSGVDETQVELNIGVCSADG